MSYIAPEVVAKAKEMDLYTYLKNYEPYGLVHCSGNIYITRTHDSLKISNGKWMWWSKGIDMEIIRFCLRKEVLYESENYHNVVFIGMDKEGKARYAALRGTGTDFIGDANGSDRPPKTGKDVLL